MQNSVCLANRWALEDPQAITVVTERRPDAVQIDHADYDPQAGRLRIIFRDATALVIQAGSGREL